jgi:hypothetical protein
MPPANTTDAADAADARAEVEQVSRRATLDVISRAAFRHDFRALAALREGRAGGGGSVDSIQAWDELLGPAQLLGFNVPLPDAWVPGYAGYLRAIEAFEGAMLGVLKVRVMPSGCGRRAAGAALPAFETRRTPLGPHSTSWLTSTQERKAQGVGPEDADLLSHMLRAQQQLPHVMTDKQIRDELMT